MRRVVWEALFFINEVIAAIVHAQRRKFMSNSIGLVLDGTYEEIIEQLSPVIIDKNDRELFLNFYMKNVDKAQRVSVLPKMSMGKVRYFRYKSSRIRVKRSTALLKKRREIYNVRKQSQERKLCVNDIVVDFSSDKNIPADVKGTKKYYFNLTYIIIAIICLIIGIKTNYVAQISTLIFTTRKKAYNKWEKATGESCVVEFIKEHKRLPMIKDFNSGCKHIAYKCCFNKKNDICNVEKMLFEVVNDLCKRKLIIIKSLET